MRRLPDVVVASTMALLLGGCASVARPPSSPMPRDGLDTRRYVLGEGEGDSLDEARRRAYVSIALQIQGSLRATERIEASASRNGDAITDREFLSQEIHATTRFDRLSWIRTLEATSDGGRHRVLCMLDREGARSDLDEEIERDLAWMRPRLAAVREEENLGGLARALRPLRAMGAELRPKLALRDALARSASREPPEVRELLGLEAKLESLRHATTLRLCVDAAPARGSASGAKTVPPRAEELVRAFGASMSANGWAVAPCADDGPRLEGELRAEAAAFHQAGGYPWFCTTSLSFRLVDPQSGRAELGGSRRSLRSGGTTAADACRASLVHLAADVAGALDGGGP